MEMFCRLSLCQCWCPDCDNVSQFCRLLALGELGEGCMKSLGIISYSYICENC